MDHDQIPADAATRVAAATGVSEADCQEAMDTASAAHGSKVGGLPRFNFDWVVAFITTLLQFAKDHHMPPAPPAPPVPPASASKPQKPA